MFHFVAASAPGMFAPSDPRDNCAPYPKGRFFYVLRVL